MHLNVSNFTYTMKDNPLPRRKGLLGKKGVWGKGSPAGLEKGFRPHQPGCNPRYNPAERAGPVRLCDFAENVV